MKTNARRYHPASVQAIAKTTAETARTHYRVKISRFFVRQTDYALAALEVFFSGVTFKIIQARYVLREWGDL